MEKEKFTFFWNGPFSQWHYSPFTIRGVRYLNAEMWMMWSKDQLFSGGKLADQILNAPTPKEVKALGRKVENFSAPMWNAVARDLVFVGSIAKFTQNSQLLEFLMDTQGTTLVEASPVDKIWGIGLHEDDPLAWDRATWDGTNWLGEVLTDARETILLVGQAYGVFRK